MNAVQLNLLKTTYRQRSLYVNYIHEIDFLKKNNHQFNIK
jgi:hypothetical protein